MFAFFVFILSALVILFIKPQPRNQDSTQTVKTLLKNRNFFRYLPYAFLVYLVLFLPQPLAPNYLQNQLNVSFTSIGGLGALTNLGNVVISLVLGQLPAKIGLILGQLFVMGYNW